MKPILNSAAIISFCAAILVTIWFRDGYILGTAEGVIPFYNLNRYSQQTRFAWTEYPGLGNGNEIATAYYPTFFLLSMLQNIGIPGFIIEAVVFWFILVSAGLGIYLLTKELFPDNSWKYSLLGSFFYWFNLISLVNVWNRFLFTYMFFWALLPMAAFLFIRGLNVRKLNFTIGIGVILGFFSLGLASPAFNILLWSLFIFVTAFWIITDKSTYRIFYLKFFVGTFIYYNLVNFWWISQVINYIYLGRYTEHAAAFFSSSVNLSTLESLSKSLGDLTNLTRFIHNSFFGLPVVKWAEVFFNNPLFVASEFLISAVLLLSILNGRKNKSILFLGTLFIGTIFLAKGTNPPLGEVFHLLFKNFSILHFFRDPFEKFGFLMSLAAAPLLAYSLQKLTEKFTKTQQKIIYLAFLLIVFGILGLPYFTGLVFTNMFPPTNDYSIGFKVKVPQYYQQASDWLETQGSNFRFIGFPLGDEGITYKWEKGYQGVELSSLLFSTPNILFRTAVPYYDTIVPKLEELLIKEKDFSKIANNLNVKYYMVRSDIDYQERLMRKPDHLVGLLNGKEKDGQVKAVAQFGKLTFWENVDWQDKTVYAANNVTYAYPQARISDLLFKEREDKTAIVHGRTFDPQKYKTSIYLIHSEGDPKEMGDSPDTIKQIYSFQLNYEGEYEIILITGTRDIDELKLITEKVDLQIDGSSLPRTPKTITESMLSFGKYNFRKGTHQIVINKVLTDNVFDLPQEFSLSKDNKLRQFEFDNFDSYSKYLIDFHYLFKDRGQLNFSIEHDNDPIKENQVISRFQRILPSTGSYNTQYFIDYYEPNRSADYTRLIFRLNQMSDSLEVAIKNTRIKKIINLEPILLKKTVPDPKISHPTITYTKHNPTRYSVKIKDAKEPFILVLSELFNPGWEATFVDNTHVKTHFLANAYANGWLIDKTGDFNLTLEFTPQRLLNIGKIISAVSFLGGLMYIGSSILWRKRT